MHIRNQQDNQKRTRLNQQIRVPQVRVINDDGDQLGVMQTREALLLAEEAGLDLVEISPMAKPPVCRIMDYGKYLFEQNKKRAQAKKKQKQVQVKEIKFRPTTDVGDYQVKLRKITSFIEEGDKVKVTLRFRGREMQHKQLGMDLLQRVRTDLGELVVVEAQPKMEGKQMAMVLGPNPQKKK